MAKPKFTSGDWYVTSDMEIIEVRSGDRVICQCGFLGTMRSDEDKANAALISIAPAMYKLLDGIRAVLAAREDPGAKQIEALLNRANIRKRKKK